MEMKEARTLRRGVLFLLILFAAVLLHSNTAAAAPVPEGSYTPTGSAITYTFTGDETETAGFYANVESYRTNAISNGELRIRETIPYKSETTGETYTINVRGILRGVFNGSTTLTTLVLPETISYIGQEAFANCVNLRSIQTLPAASETPLNGYLAAQQIEYRAFYGCTSLTGITLGEKPNSNFGVLRVENEAFMNCTMLNSLEIGPTVSWIEGGAFAGCGALNGLSGGIKVRDNPLFFVQGGILYFRESSRSNVLVLCSSGTPVGMLTEFPENVTQIRNQAFYGCTGLSSITIPDTVRSIGDKAFYGCIGLGNVTIPSSVASIGTEVFVNCGNGLCIICVSGSAAETYAISNNLTRSVECTVTFYNTYTRETLTKTVMSGQTVDPPTGWERAGYVLRWTDNFDSSTIVNANRSVSTVWKNLYTVTFRDPTYSGKESVVAGVEEGTEASAPNWIRNGYDLTWSTENYKRVSSNLTVDAVWVVSLTNPGDSSGTKYKQGDIVTIGNIIYRISSYTNKKVRVMGIEDETVGTVTVPNSVKFGGRTYKVTCINANAFRNNRYIKKITLGTYLRSIEHYAFYNCSKLTTVVINSKVVVNFSNYAFKKTKTSLKVYVPTKGLITTYRTGMIDAGMSKSAKVAKKPS